MVIVATSNKELLYSSATDIDVALKLQCMRYLRILLSVEIG